MPTNFPASLDSLTNPTATDNLGAPNHAAQHANANDAIEALEVKVGVTGSAVATTLEKRLSVIEGGSGPYLALDQSTPQTILNDMPIFDAGLQSNNSIFINSGGVLQMLGGGYLEIAGVDGTNALILRTASSNYSQLAAGLNTSLGYSYLQSNKDGSGTTLPLTLFIGSTEYARFNTNGTVKLNYYTTDGFVKFSGSTGTLAVDTSTYLTSLSGALLATGATTGGTSSAQEFTSGVTVGNVAVPTISSTSTLTNKRITPRVVSTTDLATSAIDCGITDQFQLTAVANTTTFSVTGTPTAGQKLIIRFKDAGVAKTIAWDAVFRAIGVTLPIITVVGKTCYVGCIYNLTDTKWDVVSVAQEA